MKKLYFLTMLTVLTAVGPIGTASASLGFTDLLLYFVITMAQRPVKTASKNSSKQETSKSKSSSAHLLLPLVPITIAFTAHEIQKLESISPYQM